MRSHVKNENHIFLKTLWKESLINGGDNSAIEFDINLERGSTTVTFLELVAENRSGDGFSAARSCDWTDRLESFTATFLDACDLQPTQQIT